MKMLATTENGSCSHDGITYKIVDGVVDLPPAAAEALRSHGFKDYVNAPEGEDLEEIEPTIDRRTAALKAVEKMERPELLLHCKDSGIEVLKGWTNALLRKKLLEAAGLAAKPGDAETIDLRQQPIVNKLAAVGEAPPEATEGASEKPQGAAGEQQGGDGQTGETKPAEPKVE